MNRRTLGALAVVLALLGSVGAGAQTQRQANRTSWWQAERAFHLTQIMARARANYNDTLVRVEIGTLAPIEVKATQEAVARMEEMVKADAARTTARTWTGTRARLAELLDQLDWAQVRYDNGMITTKEMNDALMAVLRVLVS